MLPEVTDAVLALQERFKTGGKGLDSFAADGVKGSTKHRSTKAGRSSPRKRPPASDASIRFSTRSTRAASMAPGSINLGHIKPPSGPKPPERTRVPENIRLETHELEHATVALYSIVLMMNESQREHYFNAVITDNVDQQRFLSKLMQVCANCLLGSPDQDPNLFNRWVCLFVSLFVCLFC